MINISMTGLLSVLSSNLEPAMLQSEQLMKQSVRLNLSMGGRPRFMVKEPNETPLTGSGRMYRGVESEHDATSATVFMNENVRSKKGFFYPAALHYGADVPPVSGKLMVFEKNGETIFTRKRRGFRLGPFPFMIFQEQDKARILSLCSDAIFTTSEKPK